MDKLATLLDLTDAQKAQVQTILQAEHAQMKAAFEQAKASGTKPDFARCMPSSSRSHQDTLHQAVDGAVGDPADEVRDAGVDDAATTVGHRGFGGGGAAASPSGS